MIITGPESHAPAPIMVPHCQQQAPPSPAPAMAGRNGRHDTAPDAAPANEDTEHVGTAVEVPEGAAAAVFPGAQQLVDGGMAGGGGAGAAAPPAGPGTGVVDEELLEDAAKAAGDITIVVRRLVHGWTAGVVLGILVCQRVALTLMMCGLASQDEGAAA